MGYDRKDLAAGNLRWTDLTPPEWRSGTARALEGLDITGAAQPYEKEYLRKDGTRVPVLIGSAAFDEQRDQGVAFVLDLTERRRAENALQLAKAELAHATRVMTVGELTASIAHEVNQPLGAIVTSASSCARWLAAEPPNIEKAQRALERIVSDGRRAGAVIGRIRALMKRQAPRKDWLDINETIHEVITFAQYELRQNDILLETRLAEGLLFAQGDKVQLQQVLLNLIVNATDAMSGIGDRRRELTIVSVAEGPDAVRVEVRDSGTGLDPEHATHLFEPFYTTKAEGMGIGLSISRSIIESHGGLLWATANAPHGAVFLFSLPAKEPAP